MSQPLLLRLRSTLLTNGVFVKSGRGLNKKKCLWECLSANIFPHNDITVMPAAQHPNTVDDNPVPAQADSEPNRVAPNASDATEMRVGRIGNHENQRESTNDHDLGNLMRAYQGRTLFHGHWDEDTISPVTVFETMSKTYRLTKADMKRGIPFMLSGDALEFYSTHVSDSTPYKKAYRLYFLGIPQNLANPDFCRNGILQPFLKR